MFFEMGGAIKKEKESIRTANITLVATRIFRFLSSFSGLSKDFRQCSLQK